MINFKRNNTEPMALISSLRCVRVEQSVAAYCMAYHTMLPIERLRGRHDGKSVALPCCAGWPILPFAGVKTLVAMLRGLTVTSSRRWHTYLLCVALETQLIVFVVSSHHTGWKLSGASACAAVVVVVWFAQAVATLCP